MELVKAGQVDDARRVLKMARKLGLVLRMIVVDHRGSGIIS